MGVRTDRGGLRRVGAEVPGQHLVDDTEQGVEGGLNRRSTVDGRIAVQNLLQDLDVGDKPFAPRNQSLEGTLRIDLVPVGSADEVHRHVRVDEDHAR